MIFLIAFFLAQTSSAADFTYESLVDLIRKNDLRTMEEVLPRLPKALRSNFTLMHRSLSVQPAAFGEPRVILYGKEATLTIS